MFEKGVEVVNDRVKALRDMTGIDDEESLMKLNRNLFNVPVLGFNSARFDCNLFKEFMNYKYDNIEWYVDNVSLIGTPSSMKQFVLKKGLYGLRFIDAQAYVAGGTLKQFVEDFSNGSINESKGVFPYEAINSENYDKVLSKSDPFTHEDFYSYLN